MSVDDADDPRVELARRTIRYSDDLPREGEELIPAALRIVRADTGEEDLGRFDDPVDRARRVLHSLHDPSISWSACERAAVALALAGVIPLRDRT